MNILLLTDGITPYVTGGMQRHSANLAKHLVLQGQQVTLVHCLEYGSDLPTDFDVHKHLFNNTEPHPLLRIITLHFPPKGNFPGHYLRNSYLYSRHIFDTLKTFDEYDFIYAKGFTAWYFIEQKKKGVKLPLVGVKFHGYEMFQPAGTFSQRLKSFLLKGPVKWNNENADFIFSYGGKITSLIERQFNVNKQQIIELPSGIDDSWVRSSSEITDKNNDKLNFVFVGRAERRKGIEELNKVIATLPDNDFNFYFVGAVPEAKKVIRDNVFYLGEIRDKQEMKKHLDRMDVLVCPSHSEGMPNVILESMARGLAIVATNVGAVEFIVDNANGIIIPPLDINALKNALLDVIAMSDDNLLTLKLNSIEKIKNDYLWKKISIRLIEQLKAVI